MKNPLDSLTGTAVCGVLLTIAMYVIARMATGG